ncbi:discoidin domain-containing protein [Flavobacteriaceae bacterium]|nr:discoidin domain-containing protein [Flavobacteriaceae bacterium]
MMKPNITIFNNFILKICIFFCFFSNLEVLHAQVGLGTNAPEASAVLDLSSTTQGFLPPRMTNAQMTAIATPTLGLMVYCTDCEPQGLYYYDGSYFLNSNRGAVSGNLISFNGNSILHSGGDLNSRTTYTASDEIITNVGFSGWTGDTHNPVDFSSTVRLGYTATLKGLSASGVGVLESGVIPDAQLSASSFLTGFEVPRGRLNTTGNSWTHSGGADPNPYYQVDLGQVETILAVATQGRNSFAQWVTSYRIQYSNDGTNFTDYNGGVVLTGNTDQNTVVRNDLSPTISAQYIRFLLLTNVQRFSARFEVYINSSSTGADGIATFQIEGKAEVLTGPDPVFNVSIGGQSITFSRTSIFTVIEVAVLESGIIPDAQLSASSFLTGFEVPRGRLNTTGNSWTHDEATDPNPYYQVDLGQVETISAVATQGRNSFAQWVTSYSIQYSNDGSNFTDYNGGAAFTANTDQNTVVKNDFSPTISARYIRFLPLTKSNRFSARFEVYILR